MPDEARKLKPYGKFPESVKINETVTFGEEAQDHGSGLGDVKKELHLNAARNLNSYGEFPETVKINETFTFGEEAQDDDIEFEDVANVWNYPCLSIKYIIKLSIF